MRPLVLLAALAALAACGGESSEATFTCPNGPDMYVAYAEDGVTLYFPDGRVEVLQRPDPERPNLYAKPGYRWAVGFREARLDDGASSYACDQMAG